MDTETVAVENIAICKSLNLFGTCMLLQLMNAPTQQSADFHGGNVFLSPLSISEPLCALLNGATEETKDEMMKMLHLSGTEDITSINKFFAQMNKFLKSSPFVEVAIANSVWTAPAYKVKDEAHKALASSFDMQSYPLRNVQEINAWVSNNTKGKIKEIIDQLDDEIKMVLVNAVYFKGLFATPFNEKMTHDDIFHSSEGKDKKIKMMQEHKKFLYKETAKYQAVKLEYKSDNSTAQPHFVTTVVLPTQGQMVALLQEFQSNPELVNTGFESVEGTLQLPKFTLEYSAELVKHLKVLGVSKAFVPGSFPHLTDPNNLYIDRVIHKTFLEVNEKGAEAAAVTGIALRAKAMIPTRRFEMKVDRPFLFTIHEKVTGLVMFVGHIGSISS